MSFQNTLPLLPKSGESFASFMNVYEKDCNISVWRLDDKMAPMGDPFVLPANTVSFMRMSGNHQ